MTHFYHIKCSKNKKEAFKELAVVFNTWKVSDKWYAYICNVCLKNLHGTNVRWS